MVRVEPNHARSDAVFTRGTKQPSVLYFVVIKSVQSRNQPYSSLNMNSHLTGLGVDSVRRPMFLFDAFVVGIISLTCLL